VCPRQIDRHRPGPPPHGGVPVRRSVAMGIPGTERFQLGAFDTERRSMPTARANDYEEAGRSPCAGAMARSLPPPRRRSSSHRRGSTVRRPGVPLRSSPVSHPVLHSKCKVSIDASSVGILPLRILSSATRHIILHSCGILLCWMEYCIFVLHETKSHRFSGILRSFCYYFVEVLR